MAKLFDQITSLLDSTVDAAVVLDGERRVRHYNPAYQALTGLRGRALAERVAAGARCFELFKLDICADACVGCKARDSGRRIRVDEIAAVRGDGEDLTCIVTAVPLELADGEQLIIETYRDVTADVRIQRRLKVALEHERRAKEDLEEKVRERTAELRAAQAQLVHQEKMSSLGRLVAGIAHELNNPINFVYGNVDFLGQYMESLLRLAALIDGAPLPDATRAAYDALKAEVEYEFLVGDWQKLLRSIRAGAERTAAIVADLKTFARTGGTELAEADLVAGIDTTLNLIAPLLKNRVDVRRRGGTRIPRVVCNAGHLNQVFMNILTNAAQAIVGPGWIEVEIATVDDGAAVRVVVADSGPGIGPDLMAKIGDPFFTTKEVGEGTGLGLWITANIVRAHGGTLSWGNRVGAGAEFVVTVPVAGPDKDGEAGAHTVTLARPRVLVVDDERYNRELVQRTLARYADVLVACDLDEALAACAAVAVDVLITDQRLGAGTGTELAARVRAAAPQTRIVLITGYVEDAEVIAAQAAGLVDDVIGKPFAPIALRQRVLGP